MSDTANPGPLRPSGFFALRTPLLAFEEFEAWSAGLAAPSAVAGGTGSLTEALAADRTRLSTRLRDVLARPAITEAVFVASPSLHRALDDPADERALATFAAYFARMTARCTPFGLFGGHSVGVVDPQGPTTLNLGAQDAYDRHSRLDMDYLFALAATLEADRDTRRFQRWWPNSSLYIAGGRWHYAEARVDDKGRSYHLVAVEPSLALDATLARATEGADFGELVAGLTGADIDAALAAGFVHDLVDAQLLITDLAPAVTGPEAVHGLVASLGACATDSAQAAAAGLAAARDALARIDAAGLGVDPADYIAIRGDLEPLDAPVNASRLIQVDMTKPAAAALGPAIMDELARAVDLLAALSRPPSKPSALAEFCQRFEERWETAEMPLSLVLDEEVGIGFDVATEPGGEPLLAGLSMPDEGRAVASWQAYDDVLLGLLTRALAHGDAEVRLEGPALEALRQASAPAALPAAAEAFVRLEATSEEAVDRGEFSLLISGVNGPPGARLLGRFCHADAVLEARVRSHLAAEEALSPEAIFAEIVHLPEGRIGNILARPVLRGHEIVYLGRSGAPVDQQITVADLTVTVRRGRVMLRSSRLGRPVIPRLTTAHNFSFHSLGIYRFLCSLAAQEAPIALGFDWGPLGAAPFLPRVTSGRLVLARASWAMTAAELDSVRKIDDTGRYLAVQAWRVDRGLPRLVVLAEADNELLIDLDNVTSIDTLLRQSARADQIRLLECFPDPARLCTRGPEGRFHSELVVPFVRSPRPAPTPVPAPPPPRSVIRRFPPGSTWLYAKLYTGVASADSVLLDVVGPLMDGAIGDGSADSWFFLRYADPHPHLRVRVRGRADRLTTVVLAQLHHRAEALLADGRLWRVQLDTYIREVERYGGHEGIELCEDLFRIDSDAVLSILASVPGDEGLAWRWKLALAAIDQTIGALGLVGDAALAHVRRCRDGYLAEFDPAKRLLPALGRTWRAQQGAVIELLDLLYAPGSTPYPAIAALRRRAERSAALLAELRRRSEAGLLGEPLEGIATSLCHLHAIRLLRSSPRRQELAIYDLLERTYRAREERASKR